MRLRDGRLDEYYGEIFVLGWEEGVGEGLMSLTGGNRVVARGDQG